MTEQVQEALEKQLQLLSERSQGDEIMPDELYQLSQAMVLIAGHLALHSTSFGDRQGSCPSDLGFEHRAWQVPAAQFQEMHAVDRP